MKNKLLIVAIVIIASAGLAFKIVTDKGAATATQQQGIFIFMYSQPVNEFEFLGSVDASGWVEGQSEQMASIFRKIKKKYPTADGVIFHSDDPTKVDAIKFK